MMTRLIGLALSAVCYCEIASSQEERRNVIDDPLYLNAIVLETDGGSVDETETINREIELLAQEMKRLSINPVNRRDAPPPPNAEESQPAPRALPSIGQAIPVSDGQAIPVSDSGEIQKLVGGHKRRMMILSRPTAVTRIDSPVTVKIGQVADFPYMERIDDDTFKLRYLRNQEVGIEIEITPSKLQAIQLGKGETRRTIQSSIKFALTAMGGRIPIKEVNLPIGKPIITRHSVETSVEMQEGEPTVVGLPVASGKHVFMILFWGAK